MVQKRDNKDMEILAYLVNSEAHIRGMEKAIKMPHATLIRKLGRMEKQDIVDYRIIGKNKQYFIRKNMKSRNMLKMMESYKLLKFLEKHPDLEPLFEDIARKGGSGMIILFGSYAKGIPKQESDIDIYIETEDRNVKRKVEEINSRLSVKTGRFDKNSLLIKEIIRNHIMIKGAERFYEQLFD